MTVLIINGFTEDGNMTVNRFWRVLPDEKCVLAGEGLQALKDYIVEWYLSSDIG